MKFLTGLLAGAAVIVALNGELRQGKVAELAGSTWSVFLQGTADYLFPAIDSTIPEATPLETEAEQPVTAAASTTAERLPEAPSIPEPALSPIAPPEVQPELAIANALPEPVPPQVASEFVWRPFQSQISASGFANRLALSLNHPFDVHRQGPGRYQVGFTYKSAAERELVLQQIAQIMGTSR